jgi:hypothetical protein
MMSRHKTVSKRKEGAARLEFANWIWLSIPGRVIMINNTSLQKCNRLAEKQLDQQFVNEIIKGLQCSPFEAKVILEAVHKVYSPYFETSGALKPSQIRFDRFRLFRILVHRLYVRFEFRIIRARKGH